MIKELVNTATIHKRLVEIPQLVSHPEIFNRQEFLRAVFPERRERERESLRSF